MRTDRAEFSKKTCEQAWERADGNCEYCHQPFGQRRPEYHHHLPAALGGGSDLGNCRCICPPCHRLVTREDDGPKIVKAKAVEEKRAGLRRSKTQWPKAKACRLGVGEMSDFPEGHGIIRSIGWMTDGETQQEVFRALVDFPNGPPALKFKVVWQQIPVLLTAVESARSYPSDGEMVG